MFGLGKPRSKFGKWLDKQGISQTELEKAADVGSSTVYRICSDDSYRPKISTIAKVVKGLKKLGKSVKQEDFWM